MRTPATAWRRWFGLLFLILAGGMLIWGLTVLQPHLSGRGFVIYWTLCFLFTGLALLTAVVDLFAVRREARAEAAGAVAADHGGTFPQSQGQGGGRQDGHRQTGQARGWKRSRRKR